MAYPMDQTREGKKFKHAKYGKFFVEFLPDAASWFVVFEPVFGNRLVLRGETMELFAAGEVYPSFASEQEGLQYLEETEDYAVLPYYVQFGACRKGMKERSVA